MTIEEAAVGVIIFAVAMASYLFSTIAGDDVNDGISALINVVMSSLFTGMALYILIQRGWI